jgi:hypothetical protein
MKVGQGILLACLLSSPVTAAEPIKVDCTKLNECAQRIVEIGNQLLEENRKLSERVAALETIQRGVVAFDSEHCPDGWETYPAAVGRFIRGLDVSDPTRTRGSLQEDAFQGHTFGDGQDKIFKFTKMSGVGNPSGYSNLWFSGIFGINPVLESSPAPIVSDNANGKPRIATETRPKNVALLYCLKK